jgi:hypothetical protein
MAKNQPSTDLESFKAQILKELREQLAKDAERQAASDKADAGDDETAKDFRATVEKVHSRFEKAAALSERTDALHLLATAFRKAGHHLLRGKDVHRAFELVAEELEQIAGETEAIVPASSAQPEA